MIDYFALLEQPRRPALDTDALKEAYLRLSKHVHPDKSTHQEGAAELNAAYQCLRNPRMRMLHLIELETGRPPELVQNIPSELSEFFMRMTRDMRDTDAFVRGWSAATGLVKAQMFEEAQRWVERLQALQREINAKVADAEQQISTLDEAWPVSRGDALTQLGDICNRLSYYGRWSSQLQEKLTRLAA